MLSALQSLEDNLHGAVNFVILPLFAFANAGVVFSGSGNIVGDVSMAVAAGLLLGKFLGIYLFTWLSIKSGLALMPAGMNWKNNSRRFPAGRHRLYGIFVYSQPFVCRCISGTVEPSEIRRAFGNVARWGIGICGAEHSVAES